MTLATPVRIPFFHFHPFPYTSGEEEILITLFFQKKIEADLNQKQLEDIFAKFSDMI